MSEDQPTIADQCRLLIVAAGQAGFAVGEVLEHYRDAVDGNEISRFSGETVEIMADALQSVIQFEMGAIDVAIARQAEDAPSLKPLSEQHADLNQLLGAVQRYLDGWI
ncbi:hypothetical protein [Sphingopyxis granuli]|uniref:hypothetical protein n=1 Tax=Sphingopyxis granuli TaxID=267128 RepID=UPI001BAFF955|nr:hypothetical protein [Sphingopyxis granuli]QUM73311.1 hypothetical protein ICN83_05340 [Sphingopyxis granuli]